MLFKNVLGFLFVLMFSSSLFFYAKGMDLGAKSFVEEDDVVLEKLSLLEQIWVEEAERELFDVNTGYPDYDVIEGGLLGAYRSAYPHMPVPKELLAKSTLSEEDTQKRLALIVCYVMGHLSRDLFEVGCCLIDLPIEKIRVIGEVLRFYASAPMPIHCLQRVAVPKGLVDCYPCKYKTMLDAIPALSSVGADTQLVSHECLVKAYEEEFERCFESDCYCDSVVYWEQLARPSLREFGNALFPCRAREYVDKAFGSMASYEFHSFRRNQFLSFFMLSIQEGLYNTLEWQVKRSSPELYAHYTGLCFPNSDIPLRSHPIEVPVEFHAFIRPTCERWANLQGVATLGLEDRMHYQPFFDCVVETVV